MREGGGKRFLAALNISGDEARYELSFPGSVRLGMHAAREGQRLESVITLEPHEAIIVEL